MRGTDPTKSKWECPIMLYVCFYIPNPLGGTGISVS